MGTSNEKIASAKAGGVDKKGQNKVASSKDGPVRGGQNKVASSKDGPVRGGQK